jgi:hypothetical protein
MPKSGVICKRTDAVKVEFTNKEMKLNDKVIEEKVAAPYYEIIRRMTGDDLKKENAAYRMIMHLQDND